MFGAGEGASSAAWPWTTPRGSGVLERGGVSPGERRGSGGYLRLGHRGRTGVHHVEGDIDVAREGANQRPVRAASGDPCLTGPVAELAGIPIAADSQQTTLDAGRTRTRGALGSQPCGPRRCRLKAKQVHLATSFPMLERSGGNACCRWLAS